MNHQTLGLTSLVHWIQNQSTQIKYENLSLLIIFPLSFFFTAHWIRSLFSKNLHKHMSLSCHHLMKDMALSIWKRCVSVCPRLGQRLVRLVKLSATESTDS